MLCRVRTSTSCGLVFQLKAVLMVDTSSQFYTAHRPSDTTFVANKRGYGLPRLAYSLVACYTVFKTTSAAVTLLRYIHCISLYDIILDKTHSEWSRFWHVNFWTMLIQVFEDVTNARWSMLWDIGESISTSRFSQI